MKIFCRDARAGLANDQIQEIVHDSGPPPIDDLAPNFETLDLARKLRETTADDFRSSGSVIPTPNIRFETTSPISISENSTSIVKFGFA